MLDLRKFDMFLTQREEELMKRKEKFDFISYYEELLSYQKISDINFDKFTPDILLEMLPRAVAYTQQSEKNTKLVSNIIQTTKSIPRVNRRHYCY